MIEYRVEKQDYSAGKWRVLNAATGEQIWQQQGVDHPHMGKIITPGPVCFDLKRDALAWVRDHS